IIQPITFRKRASVNTNFINSAPSFASSKALFFTSGMSQFFCCVGYLNCATPLPQQKISLRRGANIFLNLIGPCGAGTGASLDNILWLGPSLRFDSECVGTRLALTSEFPGCLRGYLEKCGCLHPRVLLTCPLAVPFAPSPVVSAASVVTACWVLCPPRRCAKRVHPPRQR